MGLDVGCCLGWGCVLPERIGSDAIDAFYEREPDLGALIDLEHYVGQYERGPRACLIGETIRGTGPIALQGPIIELVIPSNAQEVLDKVLVALNVKPVLGTYILFAYTC